MIKAIAIDEELQTLDLIKKFCYQTGYVKCVKCFTRQEEVARYLKQYPVDLIFVDINMCPDENMSFRKMISPGTMIVLVSTNGDYAVEGFSMNALDFLVKPFSFERFMQTAKKAKTRYTFIHQHQQRKENLSLRVNYSLVKIPLEKILYIEGMDDYIRIYMNDQKPVITRLTMKAIEEKLPRYEFIRVHRSYIVPIDKIRSVRNKIIFVDNREIRLGSCYEERFYSRLTN